MQCYETYKAFVSPNINIYDVQMLKEGANTIFPVITKQALKKTEIDVGKIDFQSLDNKPSRPKSALYYLLPMLEILGIPGKKEEEKNIG